MSRRSKDWTDTPASPPRTCTPPSRARSARPLARIINSLGIRHVGFQTAIDLANWLTAETLRAEGESESAWTRRVADRLRGASAEELTAVFGIGQVVAEGIAAYFADEHTAGTLHALIDAGVTAEAPEAGAAPPEPGTGPLAGKSLVVTGTLPGFSRQEAEEAIRAAGGHAGGIRLQADRLPGRRRQGGQQAGQGGEARRAGPGRGRLSAPIGGRSMSEAIRAAIEGASEWLRQHPDEARYTDSPATARVDSALRITVTGPNGESIATDMPSAVGGAGSAPSPGWLYRAALAACVLSLATMRAAQLGLASFQCEVDGRLGV